MSLLLTVRDVVRQANHWCFPQPSAAVVEIRRKRNSCKVVSEHNEEVYLDEWSRRRKRREFKRERKQ